MTELLPIGSVVQLKNGQVKIMIINRYPLYDNKGEIGYLDYSGCVYPFGMTDNQACFFNNEDIEKVWFEGYIDESEEEMQVTIEDKLSQIPYPKYSLADIESVNDFPNFDIIMLGVKDNNPNKKIQKQIQKMQDLQKKSVKNLIKL